MIIAASYLDLLGNTRYRFEGSGPDTGILGTGLEDVFARCDPPPRPNPSRTANILTSSCQDKLTQLDQRLMSSQQRTVSQYNQRPLPSCTKEEDKEAIIRLRRNSPMILKRPVAKVIGRSRLSNEVTYGDDDDDDDEDEGDSDSSSCGPESPTEKHSTRRQSSFNLRR
jgi:hypothetical protein